MKIDLDKKDLITLVCGNSPGFDFITEFSNLDYGSYNGSYGTWNWNHYKLEKLSDGELWELHIKMKR